MRCVLDSYRSILAVALSLLIVVTFFFSSPSHATAEGITDYVPEDALGFVKLNNLRATSDKLQKLANMIGVPAPSPLDFLKASTGLAQGLDENGDALVALIPGSRRNLPPEPMLLLPTTDYRKFATALDGDVSGAISSVKVAGEEVLLCKMGGYALLMNVEHRETLQIITGLEPAPVDLLDPWAEWLEKNEASVVIMPEGKKWLVENGIKFLDKQIEGGPGTAFDNPAFAQQAEQMKAGLKIYRSLLEIFGREMEMAAFGLAIDDQSNIVFGKRYILQNDLSSGRSETTIGPLTGYAEEPFVVAGGCAIPQGFMESMMDFWFEIMRSSPEAMQLPELSEEEWNKFEKYGREAIEQVRFSSGIMLPGEAGDPLMSNLFATYEVENSRQLLDINKAYFKQWNETLGNSDSEFLMKYEVEDVELVGCKGLLITMELPAAQKQNDAQFDQMTKAMFGEEGILRIVYLAVEENLLLMAFANEENIEKIVERLKQRENSLEQSELVAETKKLMPTDTVGRFYISPQGCAQWAQRMLDGFGAMYGGARRLPQLSLPETAPIGIAIRFPEKQLSVDVIWPASITKTLVEHFRPN